MTSTADRFGELSTPLVADAIVRLGVDAAAAPPGIRPMFGHPPIAGRALPVRHFGSVDVFLEALEGARPGDVLVIDNGGRLDEGCIGDLITLECQAAGIAAIVIWGAHRDSSELRRIGLPIFSYGQCSFGPRRLDDRSADALTQARFGDARVQGRDVVFADADGVLFAPEEALPELLDVAEAVHRREREQATRLARGETLRQQLQMADYLRRRASDPSYSFRRHLRQIGGAVEE